LLCPVAIAWKRRLVAFVPARVERSVRGEA